MVGVVGVLGRTVPSIRTLPISAPGVASSRFEHERCLILVLCVLR